MNRNLVVNRAERNYSEILSKLYNRYYKRFTRHSEVTSSFWRSVGWHKVEMRNGCWSAQGVGFGRYLPANVRRRVLFLPIRLQLFLLLKRLRCPSYLIDKGRRLANKGEFLFDYDFVRQVLSLHEILKQLGVKTLDDKHYPLSSQGIKVACVIGDGYGYLSALLRVVDSGIKVISVNLGRTLFFDVLYSQKYLPMQNTVLLRKEDNNKLELLAKHNLVFCEAENYHILEGMPIDLFINIVSMQEMDPPVIEKYFDYITSSTSSSVYFYCCNRLEKELPDGMVTRFMEYPWKDCIVLLDELCPWCQKCPLTKPPFWKPFDGPIQHRFVKWKADENK
ncbi:MAG: putative sugar O-methyltransferase [Candidatus Scalindua sediminis]|nr:putative sugar O-methyltransferase [Candidatus Scalindua sediminis]